MNRFALITFPLALLLGFPALAQEPVDWEKVLRDTEAALAEPINDRNWEQSYAGRDVVRVRAGFRQTYVVLAPENGEPGTFELPLTANKLPDNAQDWVDRVYVTAIDNGSGEKRWSIAMPASWTFDEDPNAQMVWAWNIDEGPAHGFRTGGGTFAETRDRPGALLGRPMHGIRVNRRVLNGGRLETGNVADLDTGVVYPDLPPTIARIYTHKTVVVADRNKGHVFKLMARPEPQPWAEFPTLERQPLWEHTFEENLAGGPFVASGSNVFVVVGSPGKYGALLKFNGLTGVPLWRVELPEPVAFTFENNNLQGRPTLPPRAAAGMIDAGMIYVVDQDGDLHIVHGQNGQYWRKIETNGGVVLPPTHDGGPVIWADHAAVRSWTQPQLMSGSTMAGDLETRRIRALLELGRTVDALVAAANVLERDPNNNAALHFYAEAALKMGDAQTARRTAIQALNTFGDWPLEMLGEIDGLVATRDFGAMVAPPVPLGAELAVYTAGGDLIRLDADTLKETARSWHGQPNDSVRLEGGKLIASQFRGEKLIATFDPPPTLGEVDVFVDWAGEHLSRDAVRVVVAGEAAIGYSDSAIFAVDDAAPGAKLIDLPNIHFARTDGQSIAVVTNAGKTGALHIYSADGKTLLNQAIFATDFVQKNAPWQVVPVGDGWLAAGFELLHLPNDKARPAWRYTHLVGPQPQKLPEIRAQLFTAPRVVGDRLLVVHGGTRLLAFDKKRLHHR